jgi:sortase A
MTRTRSRAGRLILQSLEWGLLSVGAALAVWCFTVWFGARRVARLPVPPPTATVTVAPIAPGPSTADSSPRHALASGAWLGRLEAPSVHLAATVLQGSDDHTLSLGAGHIEDTAWPGDSGNMGIAGHRDTTFRAVRHLRVGDPLVLTTEDWEFRYRVLKLTIVRPEDVYVLDPTEHATLTLVTCYPFEFIGHAPKRFIVSAELVSRQRRDAALPALVAAR